MKRFFLSLLVISGCLLAQDAALTEQVARAIVPDEAPDQAGDNAPVRVPPMKHYARLWADSLFTTRAMATPAASASLSPAPPASGAMMRAQFIPDLH